MRSINKQELDTLKAIANNRLGTYTTGIKHFKIVPRKLTFWQALKALIASLRK